MAACRLNISILMSASEKTCCQCLQLFEFAASPAELSGGIPLCAMWLPETAKVSIQASSAEDMCIQERQAAVRGESAHIVHKQAQIFKSDLGCDLTIFVVEICPVLHQKAV